MLLVVNLKSDSHQAEHINIELTLLSDRKEKKPIGEKLVAEVFVKLRGKDNLGGLEKLIFKSY